MKKIMIVDDERISLMMTNHILATEYETICASSGDEAVKLYEQERPDMILSDLRMPGISGFELQKILEEKCGRQIPFMFMTADHDDETESKGFENGAMDFIKKPFRADVLLRRIGNIMQNVEEIKDLKQAAETDPMTGLLNKASSEKEIDLMCRTTQGVLMMVDLDSFKPVNDIYGHDMGDKVLIRFAEIIRSVVRSSDLVGRIGGDEFIVYCQNIRDEEVVAAKTRAINEEIVASAREFMGDDMSIPLGASIGCATAPEEGTDFQTLYKKADKALYEVKQNGKHGYRFYHEHTDESEREDAKTTDIANVIKILNERGIAKGAFVLPLAQFKVIYQFLNRVHSIYQKDVWILLFSISEVQPSDMELSAAAEEFQHMLSSSLRQSDVITQQNKTQFLVLLFEIELPNVEIVINRIMDKWKSSALSKDHELAYELEALG